MHIGKENNQYPYNMAHNSERFTLEKNVVEKDLGVYLDKDLNFDFHIQQGRANRQTSLLD